MPHPSLKYCEFAGTIDINATFPARADVGIRPYEKERKQTVGDDAHIVPLYYAKIVRFHRRDSRPRLSVNGLRIRRESSI